MFISDFIENKEQVTLFSTPQASFKHNPDFHMWGKKKKSKDYFQSAKEQSYLLQSY